MFPEFVCGLDVHIFLADGVVFRDRDVTGAGAEGIFNRLVCGSFHDAAVPIGVHIHALDEHEELSPIVMSVEISCAAGV